jgi:hypothetical protein
LQDIPPDNANAERWRLSREPRREGDAERLAPEKRSRL